MTNHEIIKLAFAGVKAPEGIADRILSSAENSKHSKPRTMYRKRGFAVAAIIVILAVMATSALAYARVIDFSRIYAIVFGDRSEYVEQYIEPFVSDSAAADDGVKNNIAGRDQPQQIQNDPQTARPQTADPQTDGTDVEKTVIECEYDGIVLTLISAINDGDVLRIFATMQDTTGDRVSGSIHFDDWVLSQGDGGNISVVDYDRATRTATLIITSLGGDHEGSARLSISGFTTDREWIVGQSENSIDVYDILQAYAPQIKSLDEVWVTGGAARSPDGRVLFDYQNILGLDETDIRFANAGWTYISNLGFVDGFLHIQTAKLSGTENMLVGINFVNENNEVVYSGNRFLHFIANDQIYFDYYGEPYRRYIEIIFEDITGAEQLMGLSMVIDYVEWGSNIEGKWEFSFDIPEKITTEFAVGREIDINGSPVYIETLSISPLGVMIDLPVNLAGAGQYRREDHARVIYSDGTIVELNETYIGGRDNESTLKFGGNIIEVERVVEIVINGEVIPVR